VGQPFPEGFTHRLALETDAGEIAVLMDAAISQLLPGFLSPAQVALSRAIMGPDRQLVADGTYFVMHDTKTGRLAACGGWSARTSPYGGHPSTPERNAALLRIAKDAARIRAMYTHPDFVRRGLGRRVLEICEGAAREAGFSRVELMATLAGEPLYRACGYHEIEPVISASLDGVDVPGLRMGKALLHGAI